MRSTIPQLAITISIFLALSAGTARAIDDLQRKRIDYLITSVENLGGAKFVRNGSGHDGKEAAAHLRMKLGKAGSRVRSAEDFIDLCATKSYLSGKPYLIVFPDGRTVSSGDFLRERLHHYPKQR